MLLTDDHNDRMRLPTKRNILRGFEWLMRDLQDGESLFFYFAGARRSRAAVHCCIAGSRPSSPAPRAGHGGQQRDRAGVEPSGYNQTICPCDYAEEGAILDTQIHKALVKPLPRVRRPRRCTRSWLPAQLPSPRRRPPRVAQSVTLQALIDSCHSGTVMNLPWNAELERGKLRRWSEEYKGEHWKRVCAPARARVLRQRAMPGCRGHSKPLRRADHRGWLGGAVQRRPPRPDRSGARDRRRGGRAGRRHLLICQRHQAPRPSLGLWHRVIAALCTALWVAAPAWSIADGHAPAGRAGTASCWR